MLKKWFDKQKLDITESVTKILINVGIIIGTLFVVIFIFASSSDIRTAIDKFSNFLGVKISNELNNNNAGPEDSPAAASLSRAAQSLGTKQDNFWIYLGATPRSKKGPWIETNINSPTVPNSGDLIGVTTDVFERNKEPKLTGGEWIKGSIEGALQRNKQVTVQKVIEIVGTNNTSLWWAQVTTITR